MAEINILDNILDFEDEKFSEEEAMDIDDDYNHHSVSKNEGSKVPIYADENPDEIVRKPDNNSSNRRQGRRKSKSKRRKKNVSGNSRDPFKDTEWFVLNTCRYLKEPKTYLVWEAVKKLGDHVVRELVEEVKRIESRGGQMTLDGKRRRTPGGVLWNVIKLSYPTAYSEIMQKSKEFEKEIRKSNYKACLKNNERKANSGVEIRKSLEKHTSFSSKEPCSQNGDEHSEVESGEIIENDLDNDISDVPPPVQAWVTGTKARIPVEEKDETQKKKLPVKDRIRFPVGYADLDDEQF